MFVSTVWSFIENDCFIEFLVNTVYGGGGHYFAINKNAMIDELLLLLIDKFNDEEPQFSRWFLHHRSMRKLSQMLGLSIRQSYLDFNDKNVCHDKLINNQLDIEPYMEFQYAWHSWHDSDRQYECGNLILLTVLQGSNQVWQSPKFKYHVNSFCDDELCYGHSIPRWGESIWLDA